MNFQMMISAIGQKQLGPGDDWGYWLYISFVVISSFDESVTETPKKTGERQTSQRSNSDKRSCSKSLVRKFTSALTKQPPGTQAKKNPIFVEEKISPTLPAIFSRLFIDLGTLYISWVAPAWHHLRWLCCRQCFSGDKSTATENISFLKLRELTSF